MDDERMVERERLLQKMADSMRLTESVIVLSHDKSGDYWTQMADVALRVIEAPLQGTETYSRICNCGQNGFPENSIYSNHDHTKDCPQYTGK